MPFKWTEDLATGLDDLDQQHKDIFKWAESFSEACRQGKGAAELTDIMKYLHHYTLTHFAYEEKYMSDYGYPGLALQQAQHNKFVETLSGLSSRLTAGGATAELAIQTNVAVIDWLINHIVTLDKAMAIWIKKRVRKPAGPPL
jgi:hemerythrin